MRFLDEAHFTARNLAQRRALSKAGEPVIVCNFRNLRTTFSVTMVTRFAPIDAIVPPVVMDIREESNTQWDFLQFIAECIQYNLLERGDYLILDNASIHGGSESLPALNSLLVAAGIQMVYLPAYSPELNPFELVWGFLKRKMQDLYFNDQLHTALHKSLLHLSQQTINKFYRHCNIQN